jgi:hypothetical protein
LAGRYWKADGHERSKECAVDGIDGLFGVSSLIEKVGSPDAASPPPE